MEQHTHSHMHARTHMHTQVHAHVHTHAHAHPTLGFSEIISASYSQKETPTNSGLTLSPL